MILGNNRRKTKKQQAVEVELAEGVSFHGMKMLPTTDHPSVPWFRCVIIVVGQTNNILENAKFLLRILLFCNINRNP